MKVHVHNHTMIIYIQDKFHEIQFIGDLVMSDDRKNKLKLRQSKGKNSPICNDTLMKLHVHNKTMVIHIQYKFQEIPFIGSLVMLTLVSVYVDLLVFTRIAGTS